MIIGLSVTPSKTMTLGDNSMRRIVTRGTGAGKCIHWTTCSKGVY